MIFSYFFDLEKKHLLNCEFQLMNEDSQSMTFNLIIEEVLDGTVVKRETGSGRFNFSGNNRNINLTRTRYSAENKWIFEAVYDADNSQKYAVGLISQTLNQNPLGMDIKHSTSNYRAVLRGNNLARLEQSYVPPIIEQTIVRAPFNTPTLPKGFTSNSAQHDDELNLMRLSDFHQLLSETINPYTRFMIKMNLAPLSLSPIDENIFVLELEGIGFVTFSQGSLKFRQTGSSYDEDNVEHHLNTPEAFFQDAFLSPSHMEIEGDGLKNLRIKYADLELLVPYNAVQPLKSVRFSTGLNSEEEPAPIVCLLDNLLVTHFI